MSKTIVAARAKGPKKTKRPALSMLEELKAKADEALAWKRSVHPKAPSDPKGFAYYFAGYKAAKDPDFYDRPEILTALRIEGLAIWWRTLAHVEAYRAALDEERAWNRVASGRSPKPRRAS